MLEHQQQLQVLSLAGGGGGGMGGMSGPVGVAGYYNQPAALAQQQQQHEFLACGSPASSGGSSHSQHALNLNELGEANLLEMLQVLTRRRDELRLMDKQLFDLMAECCVRLKPVGASEGQQAIDLSPRLSGTMTTTKTPINSVQQVSDAQLSKSIDGTPRNEAKVGVTVEEQEEEADENGKRKGCAGSQQGAGNFQSRYSPSLHIKKMRLLSGIVSQDDIGEKQQVLAEKELDVREEENDDGKQARSGEKQMICSNSTSSSSFSSLLSSLSSEKHAYQQQANNNNNKDQDYHRQQQHLTSNQVDQHHASDHAISTIKTTINENYDNNLDDNGKNNAIKRAGEAYHQFDSSPSGASSSSSGSSEQDQDGLAIDTSGGGGGSANENYGSRPKLQKFCSIGTAEMSFERSLRQQHLIDSALATLVHQQQQQQQANMLVPIQQQQPQASVANCFASSPPMGYGKQQAVHAMLSPLMHLQQVAAPQVPLSPVHLHPQHLAVHFGAPCSGDHQQVLACHKAPVPLALGPPPPLSLPGPEQQLVYMHPHPQHQHQHQQQQPQQQKISPFDRMLVNAKDLGPIVRKMSFRCHVCSSCFEDRHRLQQHLSIHLNLHASWFEERVIKKTMAQYELRRGDYLCQDCQLRYETTAEFDKHMHMHGEKPHKCELCQQDNKFVSFRYFRQLLTHLRSHCFEFTCRFAPECRHVANRKDYLKLHILKHHLNNKLPEQLTICCH